MPNMLISCPEVPDFMVRDHFVDNQLKAPRICQLLLLLIMTCSTPTRLLSLLCCRIHKVLTT